MMKYDLDSVGVVIVGLVTTLMLTSHIVDLAQPCTSVTHLTDECQNKYHGSIKYLGWFPLTVKIDFETTVSEALKECFPETALSDCSYHYN